MIEALYFLAAENLIIDQRTNKVSLINVLEHVTVHSFPYLVPQIFIVASLLRSPDEPEEAHFQLKATLSNVEIGISPGTVSFLGKLNSRLIVEINGVPLLGPGEFKLHLHINETEVSTFKILLRRAPSLITSEGHSETQSLETNDKQT